MQSAISTKLTAAFSPSHLSVLNESDGHSVAPGSETHFKVIVVSDMFDGQKVIQRHRAVNSCLAVELNTGVHALSIVAKTPLQWDKASDVKASPPCMGGDGSF